MQSNLPAEQFDINNIPGAKLFINSLFDVSIPDALVIIEDKRDQIGDTPKTEVEAQLLLLLESFWNLFQSQAAIIEKADFYTGAEQLERAVQGFEVLGLDDFHSLALGLEWYFLSILDFRSSNLTAGLEKIKLAKEQFKQIDIYEEYFGPQIEALEAESLFMSGVNHITNLDYENGEVAIEKAVKVSKEVANKYCTPESAQYYLFTGLGFLYNSFLHYFICYAKLGNFDFEYFDYSENEANESSMKAIEYLSQALGIGENVRINLQTSKGLSLLSQVVFSIGQNMHFLLTGKTDQVLAIIPSKKMIKNARKFFADIGEDGIVPLRICKELREQLINLEKFIRSNKTISETIPEYSNFAEHVRKLLVKGNNKKAIDYLMKNSHDFDLFREITLLHGRYARLEKEKTLGEISDKDFRVEENKFSSSILNLVELIESS